MQKALVERSAAEARDEPLACPCELPRTFNVNYFLVALPSMAVVQFVPSLESSYFMVYEVGESTLMV